LLTGTGARKGTRLPREDGILDTYGLPHRLPAVFAILILILFLPGVAGLWRISRARELSQPPGRHPVAPPSTR
jgi:hypothetical protein